MSEKYINASLAAKEYGLFLKIVTSVKSFDTYNNFFNIFDQQEEPCRRIAVLTKLEQLEEVYDEDPNEKLIENKIIDGNLWIQEYSLLVAPEKIMLQELMVSKKVVEEFIKTL